MPLPAAQRQTVPLKAIGTIKHFAPQQTIFSEGEPALHVMLVAHGMVRSCSHFSNGRRFIGAFYAGGDIFGMERNITHFASAEAVSETSLVLYPASDWFSMLHGDDDLSAQIFSAMMRSTEQVRGHAQMLGRCNAIEKLSAFLLECLERSGVPEIVMLEMTRQDIADYLGLTVETVSRCLSRFRRDKLIEFVSSRQINILDVAGLRAVTL